MKAKDRIIVWLILMLALVMFTLWFTSCMVTSPSTKAIMDANDPIYVKKYIRTLYWDCEVAQIGEWEFIIKDGKDMYILECLDPYTPNVTKKYKVYFKKPYGVALEDE